MPSGPLSSVDLVDLGARSGFLWRSERVTLAGAGAVRSIDVSRPGGGAAAQDELGPGRLGFAVFPFDPASPGLVFVPQVVLVDDGDRRRIVVDGDLAAAEAVVLRALARPRVPPPSRIEIVPARAADRWRDDVVALARERIRAGELTKAVLARRLRLEADRPFDHVGPVRRLATTFPDALLFSVDGFIGASPELLVARDGRSVRAHPLAGTVARRADPLEDAQQIADLRASTKDQMEHRITIDWLLGELLRFCSYVDAEPEPSVVSLANVHHLATVVEGVLSAPPPSVMELVAAVHPTPALGGAPQAAALDLINELEGFDRGRYGGPVGWVDGSGNGEFAVAVRSAQLSDQQAWTAAGVGVVHDSDPQQELEETQVKFAAALGALLREMSHSG